MSPEETSDSLALSQLIRAYQSRGHEAADLDPLGLHSWRGARPPELDPKVYGFENEDMNRTLSLKGTNVGPAAGYLAELAQRPKVTVSQVVRRLEETYCRTLGVEYMHMRSPEKINWIRRKVENPAWLKYSKTKNMTKYEVFPDFLKNLLLCSQ